MDELILSDETTTRFEEDVVWTIVRVGILVDSPRTTFRLTTNRDWFVVVGGGGDGATSWFFFGESVIILRVIGFAKLKLLSLLLSDEFFFSSDFSVSDGIAIRRTIVSFLTVGKDALEFNTVSFVVVLTTGCISSIEIENIRKEM